jgi:hypothetical protein
MIRRDEGPCCSQPTGRLSIAVARTAGPTPSCVEQIEERFRRELSPVA